MAIHVACGSHRVWSLMLRRRCHGRHNNCTSQACALLGVTEAPRLYVKFSLTPAAYAVRVPTFCHTVVLTSALLELLDPPELQAVRSLPLTAIRTIAASPSTRPSPER
jgi:hypothetical protein